MPSHREFYCRVPASLAKDLALSSRAKLLYLILVAHADGRTGRAYLRLRKLDSYLGCGRVARVRAQRELVRAGWLRLERKPARSGQWGPRVFVVAFSLPPGQSSFSSQWSDRTLLHDHSLVSR